MHYSTLFTMENSEATIIDAYNNGMRTYQLSRVPWIVDMVNSYYGNSFNEKLYNLIFKSSNRNCLHCNIATKFYEKNFIRGYGKFCSSSCSAKFNEAHKNSFSNDKIRINRNNKIKQSFSIKSENDKKKIIEKRLNTLKKNYHPGEIGNILSRKFLGDEKYDKLNNYEFLVDEYLNKKKGIITIAEENGVSDTAIYNVLKKFNIEKRKGKNSTEIENIIEMWLNDNDIIFIKNDRNVLKKYELDFYCPDFNIAIELCGLYWHSIDNRHLSDSRINKKYHQNKFLLCKDKNIKLFTIFEDEIVNNFDIVKNRLQYAFNKNNNKIYARKCSLKEISKLDAKIFLKKYHSQSSKTGSINIGLYHENVLVTVATLNKPRYNSNYDLELLRFCTKNCVVIGGLSKIMKSIKGKSILSYSCNRWGNGSGYEKAGFKNIGITPPSYYYFKPSDNNKRYHRTQFQKHKIITEENKNMTEIEIMKSNGYMRIYDCGNTKWEYNNG